MTFSITSFLFVGAVFLLFYFIRRRARAYFLLVASIAFIAYLDVHSCIWVLMTSLIIFGLGHLLQISLEKDTTAARSILLLGIGACVISLFVLKHVARWTFTDDIFKSLIMPVGFSYYIFQAIAYLSDIYRKKIKAEDNLLFFLLYMCYFPKFVSGPIEKPGQLLPQIRNLHKVRMFDDKQLSIAFADIIYGFFLKVIVADRIAMYTPKLLEYPHIFGTQWLFAGMLMYTLQIYCDFAGYSAVAVGVSRVFGITLTENFHAPYLSPDITTFWRRWHVSLSSWLRDYVYIPLGGNRKGFNRKLINIMIVFIVCGLWHGAGISFIIWGLLHGIYSIMDNIFFAKIRKEHGEGLLGIVVKVLGTVLTFFSVAFAWIFFGAPSTGYALSYIGRMLSFSTGGIPLETQTLELGVTLMDRNIPVYALAVFLLDLLLTKTGLPFGQAVQKMPIFTRYTLEFVIIMAIVLLGVYGPGYNPADYMYMEF
ncbi:MBOAT family O-acyltransferase [Butyrivibrio sp. MC2021]|uniref:MBOAT family O-acyltransferase n=1 Tax=Butyrivibrio sp. MC2021 TaxID=1408306 RepID=UPI0004795EE9|nr:MBOAT family O-acyltransferase [Butyrivibrio sp. MC2021]